MRHPTLIVVSARRWERLYRFPRFGPRPGEFEIQRPAARYVRRAVSRRKRRLWRRAQREAR